MAIVKDYMIGPTHVVIRDDYFVSPEEEEEILKRIAAKAYPHLVKKMLEEQEKENRHE